METIICSDNYIIGIDPREYCKHYINTIEAYYDTKYPTSYLLTIECADQVKKNIL